MTMRSVHQHAFRFLAIGAALAAGGAWLISTFPYWILALLGMTTAAIVYRCSQGDGGLRASPVARLAGQRGPGGRARRR